MREQREKCSGKPERKGRQFPYRPKDAPRPEPLADVPGPDHPRFADMRPFVRQRKDDAERRRREQLEFSRRKAEAISDARIRRAFEREEAERQRELEAFWRTFHRKVRIDDQVARHHGEQGRDRGHATRHSTEHTPRPQHPPIALASYTAQVTDRQGRRGVYMASTYLSAKTSAYGSMRRLSYYVTRPESLEEIEGEHAFVSNMGETRHEIATGMGLVEDANRAARANAKVAVTFIVQLPHDVTPQERLRILRIWCEEKLGIHDLPYVAALHKPSAQGDQRNCHGHVVTSFRPAYRTGRYEWRIAQGLRTDLDNPAMFEEFRRDFATIMTAVVQIAGKDRVYTHLSHATRGLKHKPTEKLGPQKTRDVRAGEYVPANARNAQVIARNEALAEVDRIGERTARRRGRMERLGQLKGMVARSLSLHVVPRGPELQTAATPLSRATNPVSTHVSTALLAAAGRVTEATREAGDAASLVDDQALTEAPMLQVAAMLDEATRAPSVVIAPEPAASACRSPLPLAEVGVRTGTPARPPTTLKHVPSGSVIVRDLSRLPRMRHSSSVPARTLSEPVRAEPVRLTARTLSSALAIDQQLARPRTLAAVPPVVGSVQRPKNLSTIQGIDVQAGVASSRAPSRIAPPSITAAAPRRLASIPIADRYDQDNSLHLSSASTAARQPVAPVRRPSLVSAVDLPVPGRGLSLGLWSARFARLEALAAEAELEAKAQADADAARAAEARRAAEHERYLRFLALIVLNPDWLDEGKVGLEVTAHAPARVQETFDAWRNDHERLGNVAEVRQAALDGIHRLEPDLAAAIEQTIDRLIPRLPPPPPLRDSFGRPAPAVEFAMALIADNPHWLPAPGDPTRVSADASPGLINVLERYRHERALPDLLAAAKRHGEGVTNALHPTLARAVDHRRQSVGLRRARGGLRVMAPDRTRLSPAMVDYLAQASRHPEWLVRGKHLGLGLASAASTVFRQQWTGWTQPELARQLLHDTFGSAGAARALAPAMRSQVQDRVLVLGPHRGAELPPGIVGNEPPR